MRIHRFGLALTAGLSLLTAAASAQTLSQVWRTDAGSVTWLTATLDATRGMCYNPVTGNVLVASRQGGNAVKVLSGATGAVGADMNITGVAGGTFILNKVRTVDLGGGNYSVYVANVTTNATTTELCVYRWTGSAAENALGAPTVIFRQRGADAGTQVASPVPASIILPALGAARYGDSFDAVSNGTNTEFYFGIQGVASNRYLKMTYNEGDAAVSTVSTVTLAGAGATAGTVYAVHPESYGGKLYVSSTVTGGVGRWSNDGTTSQSFQTSSLATVTHFRTGTINSARYIAYIDGDSFFGGAAATFRHPTFATIVNDSALDTTFELRESFVGPALTASNANANATGDVYFDDVNDRVYMLVTNNYVGAYSITVPSVGTKTWDGGAASTNWYDATNWSPDGVPTYADDVVLDNSTVVGPYTVVLNNTNGSTASVRSLSIGPSATSSATITFQIPAMATATASHLSLIVAGEGTAAADINVGQFGRFEQLSQAFTGNIVDNRNNGSSMAVAAGGHFLFDSPRSYGTPFAATGNGVVNYDPAGTIEFGQTSGTAVSMSGRTYGNVTLSATAAKTYTASGSSAAAVLGNLTIGANATFNPTMTGGLTIGGNVVSNGSGGALNSTGGSATGVNFTGAAASVGGSGTAVTFPEGFTVAPGATLALNQTTSIPTGKTAKVNGTLALGSQELATVGTGVVSIGTAGSISRTTGFVAGTISHDVDATVTGPRVFDIGISPAKYAPVTVDITAAGTGVGTISAVTADGIAANLPAGVGPTALARNWTITDAGISGTTFSLGVGYQAADVQGTELNYVLARYTGTGTVWNEYSTTVNTGLHTASATGLTSFSNWTLYDPTTPVNDWMILEEN